jgi:superfamily II DNA helicase RecQ
MSKSELKDFQNKLDTMMTWSRMSRPILVVVTESSLASLKSQISHLSKHDLISLLVLDEIHLIVQDGQRFFPKLYQNTKSVVSTIHPSNTKVVCFIASPDKQMYEDLEALLEYKLDYTLWGSPVNRNSSIRIVTECKDTLKATTDQLLDDHVRDHVDKKAIIFTDFACGDFFFSWDWSVLHPFLVPLVIRPSLYLNPCPVACP